MKSGGIKKKIRETDLYKPLHDFLTKQGYGVRSENNYCDITALKGKELVIVELKTSFNLDVLLQAAKRQKIGDVVYIAVPRPGRSPGRSRWRDICHIVRRLELGLLLVALDGNGNAPSVEVAIQPLPFDRSKSRRAGGKKRRQLLKEFKARSRDMNIGGSSRRKLVTAYREKSLYIACCLDMAGPLSPRELKKLGGDMRKTQSILSNNFYGWFTRIKKGLYTLSDAGKKSIGDYSVLTDCFKKKSHKL